MSEVTDGLLWDVAIGIASAIGALGAAYWTIIGKPIKEMRDAIASVNKAFNLKVKAIWEKLNSLSIRMTRAETILDDRMDTIKVHDEEFEKLRERLVLDREKQTEALRRESLEIRAKIDETSRALSVRMEAKFDELARLMRKKDNG